MTIDTKYLVAVGAVVVVIAGGAWFALYERSTTGVVVPPPAAAPAVSTPVAATPVAVAPPADCLLPGPAPVPPNGYTANEADMTLGHDAIQNFVQQLEDYQACRNSQADHAVAGTSDKQKQTWIDEGNSAVDEANDLADRFAAQLKVYKARTPGS